MLTRTLTGRAVLVTALAAVVAVLITAAVALPVAVRAANADARRALADQARVAARVIAGGTTDTPGAQARRENRIETLVQALTDEGIETVLIRGGQPDHDGLPARLVAEVAAGRSVSQTVFRDGRLMLVEGRPAGSGDGIVLLAPPASSLRTVLGRLWIALVAGLAAGALAGALLARRLSAPLRAAAAAARRLSAGDRTVRIPVDTPQEVAAVSSALNDLAAALATSENRQRAFLTSISHELRTPLTTMKGYAEALADGVIAGDDARRAGQTMLAESEHLDRLVEDLLALARLEADDFPLQPVPVDLVHLATAAGESWGPRCALVGVPMRVDLPPHPVLVHTDPGRVRQVLDGLLENALRVVPQGAPVVLAVSSGRAEPWVGGDTMDGAGVLEVRDGGPGFADADLAVVFERGALYERYKGVRKVGSGLGLALAHRLVARHGGRIDAGHAPEGGARMRVQLPSGPPRTW